MCLVKASWIKLTGLALGKLLKCSLEYIYFILFIFKFIFYHELWIVKKWKMENGSKCLATFLKRNLFRNFHTLHLMELHPRSRNTVRSSISSGPMNVLPSIHIHQLRAQFTLQLRSVTRCNIPSARSACSPSPLDNNWDAVLPVSSATTSS
jgi:hypothetical protein